MTRPSRSADLADWRRVQQYRTALAGNYAAPWSADDDAELLHGDGPVVARAARLGRTYASASKRLYRLTVRQGITQPKEGNTP